MLRVVPCTLKRAALLCAVWHRHHAPPRGGLFALAAAIDGGKLVGVAIVGRPVSRHMADGWTAEVTRLATDGSKNACSLLYSAAWRAARALGYRRLVTYTLSTEPGSSLRGSGWRDVARVKAEKWSRRSRPRADAPALPRVRWEVVEPPPAAPLLGGRA